MEPLDGDRTARWLSENTLTTHTDPAELARAKAASGLTISVCLPALNESATIGAICELIRGRLMIEHDLVDELVVIDSGSTDDTVELARAAGATTYRAQELALPDRPLMGKGDCLWRSLSVLQGDVVVWLDSDTRNMHEGFVTDLVAPLLHRHDLAMTKAFYHRPLETDDGLVAGGGARVTELLVRPMLQLFCPELAAFVQPLSGEYAARREVLLDLPFLTGYAVEIGLLIDVAERHGVDRIAQVDLGTRVHRNRPVVELGTTAFEILLGMLMRFDAAGL
ncbi:MAG TPA: glucosyl-3-phosphoglycerate synthase, partial [Actinomycetota bacterium]|nr:glucosyl-3-phosphoglycerate synthase [Actinomycetota bacterium]